MGAWTVGDTDRRTSVVPSRIGARAKKKGGTAGDARQQGRGGKPASGGAHPASLAETGTAPIRRCPGHARKRF